MILYNFKEVYCLFHDTNYDDLKLISESLKRTYDVIKKLPQNFNQLYKKDKKIS